MEQMASAAREMTLKLTLRVRALFRIALYHMQVVASMLDGIQTPLYRLRVATTSSYAMALYGYLCVGAALAHHFVDEKAPLRAPRHSTRVAPTMRAVRTRVRKQV